MLFTEDLAPILKNFGDRGLDAKTLIGLIKRTLISFPMNILLEDESASIELGRLLSDALRSADEEKFEIHLEGNLGAGKTTIARSLINGLGWQGKVKSPTYTIYEEYQVKDFLCKHIDLYRIDNQEDVDMLDLETVSEKNY